MSFWKRLAARLRLRRRLKPSAEELASLRHTFRTRYHSFKLLLAANNKAIEQIAAIEEALAGGRPIGMDFVRSRCTRVAASVFQIIRHLDRIAPEKHRRLFGRFGEIRERIRPLLAQPPRSEDEALTLSIAALDSSHGAQVGPKMATLGELGSRVGLRVPRGFVVTAHAYRRFMGHDGNREEIARLVQSAGDGTAVDLGALSERIRAFVTGAALPAEVAEAITAAYRRLEEEAGPGVPVVLRSSALFEDDPEMSFAGQYRSEFNVTAENLLDAYRRVAASKYNAQAMTYRRAHGVRDDEQEMCVGCLPVVPAVAGGVAYTANPLDASDDAVTIHAVWGLPKPVVDGSGATDVFVVSRGEPPLIRERELGNKERAYVFARDTGRCRWQRTGERARRPSLTDEQVSELTREVLRIEAHLGGAQDVEWALDEEGSFVLLQSRHLSRRSPEEEEGVEEAPPVGVAEAPLLAGGTTASPGSATGPVCVVRSREDAVDLPVGAIMVVAQPLPFWATALDRAAAVVSERGGVAGHLANVAREFHCPALFGIEDATRLLREGRIVTVAAGRRQIFAGRVEALLGRAEPKKKPFEGSPVYRALHSAAKHIVPLHLIDPEGESFRPEGCETLHDIIRYCHEKSVTEMFDFAADERLRGQASKQLFDDVPMHYWLIDLDDGLAEELRDDRYVRLDEIESIPMLALWRGMMVIPWDGPPRASAGGFLGVLFGSATNRNLVVSMPSSYTTRNYFMISRHFCGMQLRLGYHFTTVEALVGPRPRENYVSFQFTGGAAGTSFKARRVRLIAEVLEEKGFRTARTADTVRARLEGYPQDEMLEGLEILGYLTMHTRQLDMAMKDDGAVAAYRRWLLDGLDELARLRAADHAGGVGASDDDRGPTDTE